MKRALFVIFLSIVVHFSCASQSLYVENGWYKYKTTLEKPVQYFDNYNYDSQEVFYWTVGYEHRLKHFYNSSLSIDYSFCFQGPSLYLHNPDSKFGGLGIAIVQSHNFAAGIKFPFYIIKNRLNINVGTYLKVVKVVRTWDNGIDFYLEKKRDYPYEGVVTIKAYPGIKFQPEIRIALDIRFLWIVHFYINYGYTMGFSPYQDLSIENLKINGKPHYDARSYIDGTAIMNTIGLKFDLYYKKNKKNTTHIDSF